MILFAGSRVPTVTFLVGGRRQEEGGRWGGGMRRATGETGDTAASWEVRRRALGSLLDRKGLRGFPSVSNAPP